MAIIQSATYKYNWKIISVDTETQCFVVEYVRNNKPICFNLTLPFDISLLESHIQKHAPVLEWIREDCVTPINISNLLFMEGDGEITTTGATIDSQHPLTFLNTPEVVL